MCTLLWATAIAGGCALTDARIELPYTPGGTRCSVTNSAVQITEIMDTRREPDRIGVKKNGYGTDTASYYLEDGYGSLPAWVRAALTEELSFGGLEVSQEDFPREDLPRISVNLRQFFVEPSVGTWLIDVHALVLLEVTATMPDGRQYARLFKGYEKVSAALVIDSVVQDAMLTAVQRAVGKSAAGICDLLARERVN